MSFVDALTAVDAGETGDITALLLDAFAHLMAVEAELGMGPLSPGARMFMEHVAGMAHNTRRAPVAQNLALRLTRGLRTLEMLEGALPVFKRRRKASGQHEMDRLIALLEELVTDKTVG